MMRPVYAGLLIGFALASYWLAGHVPAHGRFILPLAIFALAAYVAVSRD